MFCCSALSIKPSFFLINLNLVFCFVVFREMPLVFESCPHFSFNCMYIWHRPDVIKKKYALFWQWTSSSSLCIQNVAIRELLCHPQNEAIIPWGNVLPNTLTSDNDDVVLDRVLCHQALFSQTIPSAQEPNVPSAIWSNWISTVFQIKLSGMTYFDEKLGCCFKKRQKSQRRGC